MSNRGLVEAKNRKSKEFSVGSSDLRIIKKGGLN